MAKGYPDFTRLAQVVGTDITIPIDIKAADIMMPVDIQAQYVTLGVDIVAQTIDTIAIDITAQTLGQLNVNIAASAVTLTVTVSGTANININAQSVGVYLQPEWAALQGEFKRLRASGSNIARTSGIFINYTVPAGKTLYINCFSGAAWAYTAANGDANQMCWGSLEIAGQYYVEIGGNGGFSLSFPTPVVVAAGENVKAYIMNVANHTLNLYDSIVGYEI